MVAFTSLFLYHIQLKGTQVIVKVHICQNNVFKSASDIFHYAVEAILDLRQLKFHEYGKIFAKRSPAEYIKVVVAYFLGRPLYICINF